MSSDTMKFIEVSSPGGPEVLRISETARPKPGAGQVLIKVAAAGLNRMDILQRKGLYPPPAGASDILGVEVAGEIAAVTKDCELIKTGDRVCALLTGGGYAEYVLADAALCLPVPGGFDMIQAASLPEALFTVWSNVFDIAGLKAGQTFLVHGGSSGIGSFAIQMAKAFGARVFTTVGTEKKCRYCKRLGADVAINYKTQDFAAECLSQTQNAGINIILDMVGGDYVSKNIKTVSDEGKIVMIAAMKGIKSEVNLLSIMQKRLILTGSTLRSRPLVFKKAIADELREQVWPMLESARIKPSIFKTFAYTEAGSAHRLMESSEHTGKIVLDFN
jgi:NADPH:quinone reductase